MIDRVRVTIEPDTMFSLAVDREVCKDLRVEVFADGKVFQSVEKYKEDEMASMFDHLFDMAKHRIKDVIAESKELA